MASIENEKKYLAQAEASGLFSKLGAYTKLSGPGWLQSAITLGGGSLASSLFLGVLAGYSLLWLQPMAIVLGIIMLSAISHVTLSTGQSPFTSINNEINPVLGWGWAIATIMANIVWCLPQFSLGTAAVTQNLIPALNNTGGKVLICAFILTIAFLVVRAYDKGSTGVKIFDWVLKIMVGVVVISFFGVVIKLSTSGEADWGSILAGFVPDFSLFNSPAETYNPFLEGTGEFRSFWESKIVGLQQDVMISAAATAVGINMTFFMPFVLLRRKWGREHRGLAKFDLWTALLIPYVIATSCVVIAAGTRFNGKPESAFNSEGQVHANLEKGYLELATARARLEWTDDEYNALAPIQQEAVLDSLPLPDRQLAAMLVKRDAFNLADSLLAGCCFLAGSTDLNFRLHSHTRRILKLFSIDEQHTGPGKRKTSRNKPSYMEFIYAACTRVDGNCGYVCGLEQILGTRSIWKNSTCLFWSSYAYRTLYP